MYEITSIYQQLLLLRTDGIKKPGSIWAWASKYVFKILVGQAYEEWNRAKVVICQKLVGTKSLLLSFSMCVRST